MAGGNQVMFVSPPATLSKYGHQNGQLVKRTVPFSYTALCPRELFQCAQQLSDRPHMPQLPRQSLLWVDLAVSEPRDKSNQRCARPVH